jgi:hypothetical protein
MVPSGAWAIADATVRSRMGARNELSATFLLAMWSVWFMVALRKSGAERLSSSTNFGSSHSRAGPVAVVRAGQYAANPGQSLRQAHCGGTLRLTVILKWDVSKPSRPR